MEKDKKLEEWIDPKDWLLGTAWKSINTRNTSQVGQQITTSLMSPNINLPTLMTMNFFSPLEQLTECDALRKTVQIGNVANDEPTAGSSRRVFP